MAIFDEEIRKQIKEILKDMNKEVTLILVKKENPYFNDIKGMLQELSELSDKIKVEIKELNDTNLEDGPAIIITSEYVKGEVVYFGLPSGYEFGSFLEAIRIAGTGLKISNLMKDLIEKLEKNNKELLLEVFVTPSCPHCPTSALVSYRLGIASKKIRAHVFEAIEFPDLANKYNVSGVPHTVINKGEGEYIGGYPEPYAIEKIKEILKL